ncbi:MAG TPA: HNH endonuclease [Thermoanaerobaculia bacterium]|nr:HNH endonuclease [Thermoanaerobaculia bacterium]
MSVPIDQMTPDELRAEVIRLRSELTDREEIRGGKRSQSMVMLRRLVEGAGLDRCLEWPGSRSKSGGYGRIYLRGTNYRAHRAAWELVNGPIPKGLLALHKCDNPPCVNPHHLFLGTDADNMADAIAKGRRTIENGRRGFKLLPEQVVKIRKLRADGLSTYALGRQFGVTHNLVSEICNRKKWRSVK